MPVASRFYFGATATPNISPAFDSNWEQTGQAVRRILYPKLGAEVLEALTTTATLTIPITTTQDILGVQLVGPPMPSFRFDARNFSMVVGKCLESATTANAHLAYSLRLLSSDGGTVRGTLRSSFASITEWGTTASTRIITAGAVTALTGLAGDRLVLEIGIRASAPSAATSGSFRLGFNAASDFALADSDTNDLNGWADIEQPLTDMSWNKNLHVKVGNGMSTSERTR